MKILGDLLDKCGRAIAKQDGATFAQATAALAARLVASGYGVVDGELGVRVKATTDGLRSLLTLAAMPGADAKTRERFDSIALACGNADVRGTKFGYPPVPGESTPDAWSKKGRKRGTARRSPDVENGGAPATGSPEGGRP